MQLFNESWVQKLRLASMLGGVSLNEHECAVLAKHIEEALDHRNHLLVAEVGQLRERMEDGCLRCGLRRGRELPDVRR
jgi:hypothetical protein